VAAAAAAAAAQEWCTEFQLQADAATNGGMLTLLSSSRAGC
jgi:hypothetical protein